ncbi:hypothetical protein Patl1_34980 [Pistacia atlantica]|uniref:Uncharacterized protein n=1 Tax=Pistacia atlantica TaxID=434234 RepID=A0ACC0ZQF8_9ROSI|nr:hypothetical protein Patl1_34980 [Pistacia atlantica]
MFNCVAWRCWSWEILSCVVLCYVEFHESTIGATFFSQGLAVNDATVKFEIWDTAGQERYHSLTPMYYGGAAAAIVKGPLNGAAPSLKKSVCPSNAFPSIAAPYGSVFDIMTITPYIRKYGKHPVTGNKNAEVLLMLHRLQFMERSAASSDKTAARIAMHLAGDRAPVNAKLVSRGVGGLIALAAMEKVPVDDNDRPLVEPQNWLQLNLKAAYLEIQSS